MHNLKIYNLSESSLDMYIKCFNDNSNKKNIENIRWQFFENTESNSYVNIAYDLENIKTAAIYATSCVKFKIDSEISIGVQSLDTITDLNYRGKGLFIELAKSVYKEALNDSVSLVYGFPNGNSIHGFEKKLQWQVLDPVPFLLKPLNSKYFTQKIRFLKFLPNVNMSFSIFNNNHNFIIKENNSFPSEVNSIWKNFSKEIKVVLIRDKTYLDWRYINKPNENYKIAHCYSKENKYLGFVIYTVKEKHNGRIGYIMELIYDLNEPKSAKSLLNYAISRIKTEKADCILSWCLEHSPNYTAYKKALFINLPEKFRPIELHFGVRSFNEKIKAIVNKRENWYLSYSDSDTV